MRIGIIGAGNVGGALGQRFASAGHQVVYGVPNPGDAKYQRLGGDTGPRASVETVADAARSAEVVVLATPWAATKSALEAAGDLAGKIVIDCTNPIKADVLELAIGLTTSGAEQVAEWAPGSKVCKVFNQVGFGIMANPVFDRGRAVLFICGDDAESREVARRLAEEIGFEALDAGALKVARLLEPYAMLWIHLALTTGLGRDFAFGVLRR